MGYSLGLFGLEIWYVYASGLELSGCELNSNGTFILLFRLHSFCLVECFRLCLRVCGHWRELVKSLGHVLSGLILPFI